MTMANSITRHIPNTITCCNLLSGCMAVMAAFNADAWHALLWVVAGSLFDFCDGLSARLFKARNWTPWQTLLHSVWLPQYFAS